MTPTSPGVRAVPASAEDFALPYRHCIALSPFAASPEHTWPLENWVEVERHTEELGFRVVILDDRPDRCNAFRTTGKLLGRRPAEVVAVIRGSLCVAGNDFGNVSCRRGIGGAGRGGLFGCFRPKHHGAMADGDGTRWPRPGR